MTKKKRPVEVVQEKQEVYVFTHKVSDGITCFDAGSICPASLVDKMLKLDAIKKQESK